MAIKVKQEIKIFSTLLIFFYSPFLFAQKYSSYDYARLYSLKRCLDINYVALDSTFYKKIPDITSSLVLQSLSPEQMDIIDKKIFELAKDFYKTPPFGSYDNENANQICFFCWELYESKQMKKYLKKIINK
ncbi:hypothetical protein HNQ02_002857 [Flavobacterium sp. 7E]|uniref:hypothetical protein n=1 Tax=Flavobacterium sp. 7E TaxID=2735898 RepID=UPI00156E1C94|nr:hypothetical protein [Flavobacterium sp. 7E]NRS89923.1 hypothetical protein [Flavobacterium sp. 7E]